MPSSTTLQRFGLLLMSALLPGKSMKDTGSLFLRDVVAASERAEPAGGARHHHDHTSAIFEEGLSF